jgi:tetratricopeptide (TPR) repeat protein
VPIRGSLPPRNPRFVGREALLADVRSLLGNGPVVLLPTPDHQLGGVGRTQLAVEYAHRFANAYELVWWIPAEQTAGMRASLVGLAQRLGLPEARDVNRTLGAVRDALSRGEPYRNWLVVFENANRPEDIKPYLPSGAGHVLVTSGNPRWTAEAVQAVHVGVFDRGDSVDLLRARTPEVVVRDADRLAAHLRDVPMALDQAAAVRAATGLSVDDYLESYDSLAAELAFPTPIRVSWGLAARVLREASPAAAELLDLCAFLAGAPVSWQLVWAARGLDLEPGLARTVRIERRLKAAIRLIGRYGLAELDPPGDRLVVHPLIRGMITQQLTSEQHAARLRTVRSMLAAADPGDPDRPAHWPRYAELTAHLVHADVLGGESEEIRQLVVNCVRHLFASGDYDSSRELAAHAVTRWQASLGESDEQTLAVSFHLANALWAVGRVAEARLLNARTLSLQRDVAGDDDEATLATANSVGADLRVQGLFEPARLLDADNLVRHRRLFGEGFPTTLRCANNLAVDLRLLGDFRSARTLDEQTLRYRQTALADGHPETLSSRASLAFDLYGLGDFAAAAELLAGRADALVDDHPMMLWAARFAAMAARRTAAPGARAMATANVAAFRQKFGDLNVETLGAVVSLASCCRDAGDTEEAHRLLERAVARYHAVLGEEHPFTFAAASNLAIVVRATGRHTEARTIDAEALAGLRRTVGADHPFTLACANGYATDLLLTGDAGGFAELAADTLTRSVAVRGADHPDTLACAFNLALGTADESRAVADLAKVYGDEHPVPLAAAAGTRLETDIEPPPL